MTLVELAATALSAELTIVTKDAKDFGPTGVALGGEFDFSKAQTARLIPGTKADSQSRLSRQDYGGHRLPDHCDRGTVSRLLRLLAALECLSCARFRMQHGAASPSRERRLSTSCAVGGISSQMSDQQGFQFKKRCRYFFSQTEGLSDQKGSELLSFQFQILL